MTQYDVYFNGEVIAWVEAKNEDEIKKALIIKKTHFEKGTGRFGFPIKIKQN